MSYTWTQHLAEQINLPAPTAAALDDYMKKHAPAVRSMAEQMRQMKRDMRPLKREMERRGETRYLFALAVVMTLAEDTLVFYRSHGIPDAVFYDTMGDITIWSNTCWRERHQFGLENVDWLSNHLRPDLFRLGRLQYQFSSVRFPLYIFPGDRRRAPIRQNEPCIFIHIPEGEPLAPDACDRSLEQARRFFQQYFPAYHYRYFVTESWLIDPQNHNVLGRESNILHFGKRFQILACVRDDRQALERIFGGRRCCLADYPEHTELQRRVKLYMENHGKMGIGFGVLPK